MQKLITGFIFALLVFSACRKEEDSADFYCKVNGEKWIVYNSDLSNSDVEAYYNDYGLKEFYMYVNTEEHDEGVLQSFTLHILQYNKTGNYDRKQLSVYNAVSKEQMKNGSQMEEYLLDTTKAAGVTITSHSEDEIEGDFYFTLKKSSSASVSKSPEFLTFTDGRFRCRVR